MKAGIKSSEFWLSLAGVAAITLGPERADHVNNLIAALVGLYTAGRSAVKSFGKGGS